MSNRIRLQARLPILVVLLLCSVSFASAQTAMPPPEMKMAMVPASFDTADSALIEITIRLAEGWHINSTRPESEYLIPTSLKLAGPGVRFGEPQFPKPVSRYIKILGGEVSMFEGKLSISVPVYKDGENPNLSSIQAEFRYQACNEKMCLPPAVSKAFLIPRASIGSEGSQTPSSSNSAAPNNWKQAIDRFDISGKTGGFQGVEEFSAFLKNPAGEGEGSAFAGKSIWLIILLVLLGGAALNLTPCVLPMIPVTLAVIGAGAQASSRGRGFTIGSAYGLGMAITYGALGIIVTLTGSQFGTINSSPVFSLFIAGLFVFLALGMFDIIHIDFTRLGSRIGYNKNSRGQIIPVFFMGCLAAVLAGACVAPVVISVVLYASALYSEGQPLGLLLPFLLGAGMALPWPFAGAGLSFLPKPGKWMLVIRNAFGVIILGIALYYGYMGIRQLMNTPSIPKSSGGHSEGALTWTSSLEQGLQQAADAQKPVLIDFWATWCKNCLVMDATTFQDSSIVNQLRDYILIKHQAEDPEAPENKELLEYFKIIGLPAYIILTPKAGAI